MLTYRFREGRGVCGTEFLDLYMPRYAARVLELRGEGWQIVTQECKQHAHETKQVEYVLLVDRRVPA